MAFKKKLYQFRPKGQPQKVEKHVTKDRKRTVSVNSISLERDVRQMLAEKISGTHVGLWLLIGEHLRLRTWDLLTCWTGSDHDNTLDPRLALQMVHESALCVTGVRQRRTLRQKGFETLNGLPFVATDVAIHQLLDRHTIAEAEALQVALGQLRYARGHYPGQYVLIDPHRIMTWSQRQMPPKKASSSHPIRKNMQTFFAIDGESSQPLSFGIGSSSVRVSQATLSLIDRLAQILPHKALILADSEHYTGEIFNRLLNNEQFTILMPTPRRKKILTQAQSLTFTPKWAGYAVAEDRYQLTGQENSYRLIVQRTGETTDNYDYKSFATTSKQDKADLMTLVFPERWDIEEFFKDESALGWNRASTFNLNIRYGRLSMALIAQAVIYELRKKLSDDMNSWTAESMAQKFFNGIDGDLRVNHDKIIVTLYNAPQVAILKEHFENLPRKLEAEGIDPRVPWLYDFKVDFRFK